MNATKPSGGTHASTRTYVMIFVVLFAVTVSEVSILYIHLPRWLAVGALTLLSMVKFSLVIMFFMHLWYDGRLLALLFLLGIGMAVMTIAGINAMFTAPSLQRPVSRGVSLHPRDQECTPAVFAQASAWSATQWNRHGWRTPRSAPRWMAMAQLPQRDILASRRELCDDPGMRRWAEVRASAGGRREPRDLPGMRRFAAVRASAGGRRELRDLPGMRRWAGVRAGAGGRREPRDTSGMRRV